ncbi:MAG TPA: neutral/alkaline non-lysosomal ceramidase N-terminal domain-containing protein [Pirellulales bacterium]|nr:neutral/alkaline non-lysosomal ceramidase N-terminal domain-containing protein [Pirellulales bacterium]
MIRLFQKFLMIVLLGACCAPAYAEGWKAGAAKVKITPEKMLWMAGYAARTAPAEGTLIDLWAKALVLEDPQGRQIAIVTLDLVGIGRDLTGAIREKLEQKYQLPQSNTALCTSHTHCGPVVGSKRRPIYAHLDEQQRRDIADYADALQEKVVAVVGEALANREPAAVTWGSGQATFAVNRRNNKEADVTKLREQGALVGPVDYDVPVLAVRNGEGELKAVLFGYACHATVLGINQWSGDYPGFAQLALEAAHPGAVALFWAGCGADQNPLPRREVPLAKQYGDQLAAAVDRALGAVMRPLAGELATAYDEIDLPYERLPTRDELQAQLESTNKYEAARARQLLDQIDGGQPLRPTYPYPVQTWRLGRDLRFVLLGGEVVVDYAVRLKAELGRESTWVASYTNDVMAYIPSRRVWFEGGYEGGGAMLYTGHPSRWAPEVEELVIKQVHSQAEAVNDRP